MGTIYYKEWALSDQNLMRGGGRAEERRCRGFVNVRCVTEVGRRRHFSVATEYNIKSKNLI